MAVNADDATSYFGGSEPSSPATGALSPETVTVTRDPMAERALSRALRVGDFKAAVEVCKRNDMAADALLLSTCGQQELWNETKAWYIAKQRASRPVYTVVESVMDARFDEYVNEASVVGDGWKEVGLSVTRCL